MVIYLNEQDLPLPEDLIIKNELKGTRSATLEVHQKWNQLRKQELAKLGTLRKRIKLEKESKII